MATASVIVTGDKALDKKLAELEPALQKKLSRKASRKAANEIVLPAAKMNVPHDFGQLEESLKVRAIKRSRVRIGHYVGTEEGFFRGDTFYGAFLEFGTKERFRKVFRMQGDKRVRDKARRGGATGLIVPRKFAFLRPALYDNRARIMQVYFDAMREFISEIKGLPPSRNPLGK